MTDGDGYAGRISCTSRWQELVTCCDGRCHLMSRLAHRCAGNRGCPAGIALQGSRTHQLPVGDEGGYDALSVNPSRSTSVSDINRWR